MVIAFDSLMSYAYSSEPTKSSLLRSMGLFMTAPTTMPATSTPMIDGIFVRADTNDDTGGRSPLLLVVDLVDLVGDEDDGATAVVVHVTDDDDANRATTDINNNGGGDGIGIAILLISLPGE